MNRADCRAMATALYYAVANKHDIDDQQWNLILDGINKKYYRDAARGIGSMLAKDSADTATTATGTLDYSGTLLDPAGVYLPLAAEIKFQGRYIHLDYTILQDRYHYNIAFGQVQALIPSGWTLRGETIILLPNVSAAQILRVTYIPRLPDWTSDSTVALGGFLPDWHQLISYEAAALFAPTDRSQTLVASLGEMRSQWREFIQSRHRQEGRQIRFVPYE